MSVEANAPVNDGAVIEHNNPINDPNPSGDDALGAVWDRLERDNGAARGDGGRFASTTPAEPATAEGNQADPLEGGAGEVEAVVEPSTPATTVPLPSNWRGLEDVWAKLPADQLEKIAAHENKLHQTLSQQGQALAAYKPIGDVIGEFKEYFGGERGNNKPDEAIRTMFGIQRAMDDNPVETLLWIADNYKLRPELQKMFGAPVEGQQQPDHQQAHTDALMAEIGQLKQIIRENSDPSKIDQRITARMTEDRAMNAANEAISRSQKDMPLYADVEEELPFYIQKSQVRLGNTASHDAVLKAAYDMAVNADPDLRKKAAAIQTAAVTDPKLVADARKANSTNIRSQSTGKPREATEEEALGAVWDKHKKG